MRTILTLLAACAAQVGQARDCTNPPDAAEFLPPPAYRDEPSEPFELSTAEVMNTMPHPSGTQVYGWYFVSADIIAICKGLTGDALRTIRMHEEAHKHGWRHG